MLHPLSQPEIAAVPQPALGIWSGAQHGSGRAAGSLGVPWRAKRGHRALVPTAWLWPHHQPSRRTSLVPSIWVVPGQVGEVGSHAGVSGCKGAWGLGTLQPCWWGHCHHGGQGWSPRVGSREGRGTGPMFVVQMVSAELGAGRESRARHPWSQGTPYSPGLLGDAAQP